jgi:surface antigen
VVIYREIYYAPNVRPVADPVSQNHVWQNPGWQNPDSTSQAYEATDRGAETAADHCREYTSTATVAGQTQQIYGQACLQPDGSWKPVR